MGEIPFNTGPNEIEFKAESPPRTPRIPYVNIYHLSDINHRSQLRRSLARITTYDGGQENLVQAALESGVLVDSYPEFLQDLYRINPPPDQTAEEFISGHNTIEDSVVVERPWKSEERFVRLPPQEIFESVVRSRNELIIPEETQRRLREMRFAVAGLGVGSAVSYLLTLTGAYNFTVADGGVLNPHNLNRFFGSDVGKIGQNLAVVWSQMAYEANPFMNIRCIPQNLGENDDPSKFPIDEFLEGADMVIEEMDNLAMKLRLREAAVARGIPLVMVSDLERGGRVQFQDPNKPILSGRLTDEIVNQINDPTIDMETKTNLAINIFIGPAPLEHLSSLRRAIEEGRRFWSQIGVSAATSAAGGVNTILRFIEGLPIPDEKALQT